MKTEIDPRRFDHQRLAATIFAGWSDTEQEAEFARVAPHLWRELATTAAPVTPERLAKLAGVARDQVVAVMRAAGAEWDTSGELLVGQGVTLIRTPHRYDSGGHTVWTWCAADLLELPVLLGGPARAESPCAATGEPVRVEVTPSGVADVEPVSAVASIVTRTPDGLGAIRRSVCDQQNFYRDAEAGAGWQAAHPDGLLLPMADAFEVARLWFRRLVPAELLS